MSLRVYHTSLKADVAAFRGKFTLSADVRWGQATLAAGEDSFTLHHAYPGDVVMVRRGAQTVTCILAIDVSDINSPTPKLLPTTQQSAN